MARLSTAACCPLHHGLLARGPKDLQQNVKLFLRRPLVLVFVITVMDAPSKAALDAGSEAAPPAPEGMAGLPELDLCQHRK
jgi:hypothetical protein